MNRIENHPILDFVKGPVVKFLYNGKQMEGYEGEPIIAAIRANGFIQTKQSTKEHHHPAGPFCMQGRCSSCTMEVDGEPNVMTCVTPLKNGMVVNTQNVDLEKEVEVFKKFPTRSFDIPDEKIPKQIHENLDVAIIGGGPAGMEAALMAAQSGAKVAIFDDKEYLGGQLALQTHTFFGNEELGASERGFLLGKKIVGEINKDSNINVKLGNTVVGLFPDNIVCYRDSVKRELNFLKAKKVIVATGASEKFLPFSGNYLPGVVGAGGAQTFMNMHGVKPGSKVLVVGGGNIGVILVYQLLQAGIEVKGLVEASDHCGAYKVHVDKIKHFGIPIYLRHSIKKALGKEKVEGAVIENLETGETKQLDVDLICLAVGLNPLTELLWQIGIDFKQIPEIGEAPVMNEYRQTSNKDVFAVGDCAVIGEASIARLEGRIAGLKAAMDLGKPHPKFNELIERSFYLLDNIQRGTFGKKLGEGKAKATGTQPPFPPVLKEYKQNLKPEDFEIEDEKKKKKLAKITISCSEDIPCNPCESSCKYDAIEIGKYITQQPSINPEKCIGCGECLVKCPGRAIRLIQYNDSDKTALITFPYEFNYEPKKKEKVNLYDASGKKLCVGEVTKTQFFKNKQKCNLVTCRVPKDKVFDIKTMGVLVSSEIEKPSDSTVYSKEIEKKNTYVCRCEEITEEDIDKMIEKNYDSVHDFKRISRAGMGQCRGLSCRSIMEDTLRRKGIKTKEELLQDKLMRKTSYRTPVKRVTLGEAAKMSFNKEEMEYLKILDERVTVPLEYLNLFIPRNYVAKKKIKKRVVVIGGGAQGVMLSFWLSREKGWEDIILLEKDFLSAGATGACLGGVRTGFATSNKVKRAKKGYETFRDAKELIGKGVGFFKGGYVYASFSKEQSKLFEDTAPIWSREDIPFEIVYDKNKFDKYVPGCDTKPMDSIVYFPETGGLNPFAVCYNFAEAAQKNGAEIATGMEVVHINVENNKVKSVFAKERKTGEIVEIECEICVNAAGSYAVQIAKMAGIDLSNQIWAERHSTLITERSPFWLDPLIVSYHPTLSGYWQQKHMDENGKRGEIVACFSPNPIIKGYNTESQLQFMSRMARAMLLVQPNLENVGIVRQCAHHYVKRPCEIPIIGPTPVKGMFFNIAQAGHGMMCSPGDAYALAQTIVNKEIHPWITECTIEEPEVSEKFH